jgi:hypothetical protein
MREVELWLSSPSALARMMKILEAEGGAEAAARLASPHHQPGGHRLGKGAMHEESVKAWLPPRRSIPF